jgi:DNA repair exonuclease SbcCD ATPase subunit
MSKKVESPLLGAAKSLSDDLSRFEALSTELSQLSINSQKSLQRAGQSLQACSAHEAKLAESLRAFAEAMQHLQVTQQRCMEQAAAAAEHVRKRQLERAGLEERLALLGQKARDISLPLPEQSTTPSSELLGPLEQVEQRLSELISEVGEVCDLAQAQDWQDLTRETHSLREQLQALRNRVLLSRRKLAQEQPS